MAPPAIPSVERTVDISNAASAKDAFDIPRPTAPANAAYRSLLIVKSGPHFGDKFKLDSYANGICAIGRSDVADNQIVIRDDLKVSRVQHAIVSREASGRYLIRDNNSANKVYVNDECIDSAPVPLKNGDRIRIGLTEFEFAVEPDV
jgi:pSer/pThr/pTyr-binding forkhead associated (FHA) protein